MNDTRPWWKDVLFWSGVALGYLVWDYAYQRGREAGRRDCRS